MAVANVAALLAKWGWKVAVLDWDLEAPGIERYFETYERKSTRVKEARSGIVDLLMACSSGEPLQWRDCVRLVTLAGSDHPLSLITAGQSDGTYHEKLQSRD